MAVEGEIKFGLNVNRNLADIVNKGEGLANIGINVADLDVIRDAAGTLSINANDVKAVGGLNVEVETYITKLYNDTQQYAAIIDQTAGTTETLKGNLTMNGLLGASAIKYKYIDPDNITLKVADISTSRVSSWSSADNPATSLSPIFYGGAIEVDGVVDTPNLEFLEPAEVVRFRDSEVPTHLVEATFNGQTVYLYAMKGIPLIFNAFFRDLTSRVVLTSNNFVSWRITNETASYLTREYENVGNGSTVSELRFRDTRAAPRQIQIFVNPNVIQTLPLNGAGIENLPSATLEALTRFEINRNIIKNFPDFKQFCPVVTYLDIRENNFTLGEDSTLRKFNNNVLNRIPTTVRNLFMGNTFTGSITAQLRPGNDKMPTVNSDAVVVGQWYEVVTTGDTNWTTVFGVGGISSPGDVGLAVSSATGTGTAKRVIGPQDIEKYRTYTIRSVGVTPTDWTLIGAPNNTPGTTFEATANGADIYGSTANTDGHCYDSTVGLPNLVELSLNSHSRGGARNVFDRDSEDPTGSTPEVSNTCQNYYMYRNSFDSLAESVKTLPDLRNINLYSNGITDGDFFIESENIDYVNIGNNNGINMPNLSNKTALNRVYAHYNRANSLGADTGAFVTPQGTYKFANCSSLDLIYFYAARYNGPIPKFAGNSQLNRIEGRYTRLQGGKPIAATEMEDGKEYSIFYNPDANDDGNPDVDFTAVGATNSNQGTVFTADLSVNTVTNPSAVVIDREYVLHADIFDDTPAMTTFRISSSSLLNKPLHPEVFANTSNLYGLEIRSFNRGVSGNMPLLNNLTNLRYIVMLQNNLTGPIPNLANNPRVYYMHLYANQFSGNIPNIESNSMAYLYIHRNQLTGFNGLSSPNMRRLFISYNQITTPIPDLNNLTRMYDFYCNNNQITTYTEGALTGARALKRFDISNNPLTTGAVNTLIADMVANYENNPRSGVSVNIRNTATPTGEAVEQVEFLRTKGWNIRT